MTPTPGYSTASNPTRGLSIARPNPWSRGDGVLVLDDSTLDKLYAQKIEPVHRHWSGKHKAVVWGINLITLVWTDGDRIMPLDYRIYDKPKDGRTKNDHFRDLIGAARQRGFRPRAVLFDNWYSSLENLKLIRDCGWTFLTQLKVNRKVDLNRQGYQALALVPIDPAGTIVHLEGFGPIRVFKVVSRDGDIEYWATNDLAMDELGRLELAERCWAVEEYHRALKQCCNVERCQRDRPGRSGTTSEWRSVRSCGCPGTSIPPGSVGMRRRRGSSAKRSGPTGHIHCTKRPQLRNSYLIRGRLIAGDQHLCPPCRPVVNLLDQWLAGVAIARPGTQANSNRLSGSTAVWSQSSPRSRSTGSSGSHAASFFPTNPHFSATWTSRVRGKERRVPRGAFRHGLRPERGSG